MAEAAARGYDDAKLLDQVRGGGDSQALSVLYQRHSDAARRLAQHLVTSPVEVDEVVTETFTRVLDVLRRGGGPIDAFRCYLLAVVRRVCDDRFFAQRGSAPDNHSMSDRGWPFLDPATIAKLDNALIVRAFLSLPERWSALLWHIDIEQESPADVAPLFGLSVNGVAALERRARDGIRQAYLEMYADRLTRTECAPIADWLSGFLRYAVTERQAGEVSDHLSVCRQCRAVYTELSDVDATLRSIVAPVFLGSAAAWYLPAPAFDVAANIPAITELEDPSWLPAGQRASTIAAEPVALPAADPPDGRDLSPEQRGRSSVVRRPRLLLAIGVAALVMIATGAFAATLNGHKAPHHGPNHPAVVADPSTAGLSTSGVATPGSTTKKPRKSPKAAASKSRSGPSTSQTPGVSPSPSHAKAVLTLTASISASSFGSGANVGFKVTDSGNTASGTVTATISLPSGTTLSSHGHHGDHGGWTCEQTSSEVTCQHGPISPGATASDGFQLQLSGSDYCGQPVQLTVSSGSVSASATSDGIQCSNQNDN